MAYHSLKEILDYCEKNGKPFFEAVLDDDMAERTVTREESMNQMYRMITEYSTDLEQISAEYESTEKANEAIASALATDVIA